MKISFLLLAALLCCVQLHAQKKADSTKIYHIQDSLIVDWAIKRQQSQDLDPSQLNRLMMDTVAIIMRKRGVKHWEYKEPGYINPCDELIQQRIDEEIRRDTLNRIPGKQRRHLHGQFGNENN